MATRAEIEKLLKRVNITIEPTHVIPAIDKNKQEQLKKERTIEDFLLTNAECIEIKKLLIIIVKDLQELLKKYEEKHISRYLEENTKKELENAIKFAKLYIKPNEKIIFISNDDGEPLEITTSKEIIYGEKSVKDAEKYDKISSFIPNADKETTKRILDIFNQVLNDEYTAKAIMFSVIHNALTQQGYANEEIGKICSRAYKLHEKIEEYAEILDMKEFNRSLKWHLDADVVKENIDTDKYVLFFVQRINEKLEQKEKLQEDEGDFLKNIETILENIDETSKIKIGQGKKYGIKQVEQFLSKLDIETLEYITEEELKSGEKLLEDTNGYEDFLKKETLMELAETEENLLFLAKNKKLNNSTILSILYKTKVSEDTLVELCVNGNISVEQLEKYGTENGIEVDELKKKIKEKTLVDLNEINIKDKNQWKLLSDEEKIQLISKTQDIDIKDIEDIEKLYSTEKIVELYKEIYIDRNLENKSIYEGLIKLYTIFSKKDTEELIDLLEDEFSNEMLLNLYKDRLINAETLESYGGEELIEKAFEEGLLYHEDKRKILLKSTIRLTEEEIKEFYQNGEITSVDIKNMYLQDKINLEAIKKLNTILLEKEKIEIFLSKEELLNLYKQTRYKKEPEKQALYTRYRLLYQAFKDEKLGKEILKTNKQFREEDIVQLYKDNILTFEAILAYGGDKLANKMAIKSLLNPSDAKEFFKRQEGREKIKEILRNPSMEDIEKMILIYSTYEDDKDMRDELVKYLSVENGISNEEGERRGHKKGEGIKIPEIKTNTDPFERWKFFAALDREYTKRYIDGYVIVNLNNTQKTIIEKMYKKHKGRIVPSYGVATFVIDTDEYLRIEDEFITDDGIDISVLRKTVKENPQMASKITHHAPVRDSEGNERTSWGKRIIDRIGGEDLEQIYTEEELEEIHNCMNAVEASREEFEH